MYDRNIQLKNECFRKARIIGKPCDNSLKKYDDSIKVFFSVISKNIENLKLRDFEDFILAMRDRNASSSRISNVISAVKWLIIKTQEHNMTKINLDVDKIPMPSIERKEVISLTETEVSKFTECILQDISEGAAIRKYRIMALMMFLATSGARIGEALSINLEKINWDEKEIPIIGKGKKPRKVYLHDAAIPWIKKYLKIRKSNHVALLVTLDGKSRWTQTDVGRSFRRYRKMSGINKKFTLHTFRHSFATIMLRKGAKINEIQRLLGHTRLETTVRYYIGSIEDDAAKKCVQDKHFDFISESQLKDITP
jgi:integrase/recombinase XerD